MLLLEHLLIGRQFQIKKIRPDVNCKLIRGNVDTRIKKLAWMVSMMR